MPFSPPTSPTAGQEYTYNGVTYVFNGVGWTTQPVRSDYFNANEVIIDNTKLGTSKTKLQDYLKELSDNIPRKNLVRNPFNPETLQNFRGFSGGTLALGAYFYDCWKAIVASDISAPDENGFITINSGQIGQVLKLGSIAGQKLTLSAKTFGTEVNVIVAGVGGTINDGEPFTTTIDSEFSGDLTFSFSGDGSKLKDVQLEIGSKATSFEIRTPEAERALCLPYGFSTSCKVLLSLLSDSGDVGASFAFPVRMVVDTPIVEIQNSINLASSTVVPTKDGFDIQGTVTSSSAVTYVDGITVKAEL